MLNVGDYTVYGNHGLCHVKEILVPSFLEKGKEKLYYMMVAATDKGGVLYVPVEGAEDKVRKVMPQTKAKKFMNHMDDVEELDIAGGKKSETVVADMVKRNEAGEMMCLVKTLHKIKATRESEGKKFAAVDEKYLSMSEKLLFSEMAHTLHSDVETVKKKVIDQLSRLELVTA